MGRAAGRKGLLKSREEHTNNKLFNPCQSNKISSKWSIQPVDVLAHPPALPFGLETCNIYAETSTIYGSYWQQGHKNRVGTREDGPKLPPIGPQPSRTGPPTFKTPLCSTRKLLLFLIWFVIYVINPPNNKLWLPVDCIDFEKETKFRSPVTDSEATPQPQLFKLQ